MLKELKIEVVTEHGLNEDQKGRVAAMVLGNGHIDHQGGYVDGAGMSRSAAKIHFTSEAGKYAGLSNSETSIEGMDGKTFDEPIHIIIEGADGSMTGMGDARCQVEARWHYGVIFLVDDQAWFAGHGSVPNDGMSADVPILKRIATSASERPGSAPFDIAADLPAEGEFWLTMEEDAHLVSIPWMSGFGGDPQADANPDTIEVFAKERAIHEALIERVRDLETVPSL